MQIRLRFAYFAFKLTYCLDNISCKNHPKIHLQLFENYENVKLFGFGLQISEIAMIRDVLGVYLKGHLGQKIFCWFSLKND